jgi:hypothetical protein
VLAALSMELVLVTLWYLLQSQEFMLCFLTGPPEKVFKISGLIQLLNLKFDGIRFGFGSTKYLSKFQILMLS